MQALGRNQNFVGSDAVLLNLSVCRDKINVCHLFGTCDRCTLGDVYLQSGHDRLSAGFVVRLRSSNVVHSESHSHLYAPIVCPASGRRMFGAVSMVFSDRSRPTG